MSKIYSIEGTLGELEKWLKDAQGFIDLIVEQSPRPASVNQEQVVIVLPARLNVVSKELKPKRHVIDTEKRRVQVERF